MEEEKTGRITVTLTTNRIKKLDQEAQRKGIPTPTLCRILLSEIADNIGSTTGGKK